MTETQIPVISMWQPWAQWVSLGWKPIETRTHGRFASLLGKRIGIHASLKWDKDAIKLAWNYLDPWQREETDGFSRNGGTIICTALVKEFRKLTSEDSELALIDCGVIDRYGLILTDVKPIQSVPCKGRQGIWYVEGPTA